jgi:chromate transport protein ChrA
MNIEHKHEGKFKDIVPDKLIKLYKKKKKKRRNQHLIFKFYFIFLSNSLVFSLYLLILFLSFFYLSWKRKLKFNSSNIYCFKKLKLEFIDGIASISNKDLNYIFNFLMLYILTVKIGCKHFNYI